MVYENDYYTRRSYSRPVISSYSVSYPISRYSTGSSRVYSSSYPIYSSYHSIPYVAHKRLITGTRIVSSPSPVRVITSRTRVITSPVRVYSSPVRVYSSPVRVYSSPAHIYSSPSVRLYRDSLSPVRVYTSPERIFSYRTRPSVLAREYDRIAHRVRPGIGYRVLNDYLNSESYHNFNDETRKIRHSAQSLMREIHAPVLRSTRSVTPFPVSRYSHEPLSQAGLEAYVARVTNPGRHVAKEVHNMSYYPEPARKFVGKSHLASVRIVGDKGYSIRNPLYDPDKVRTDVNFLSHYLRNRKAASEKTLSNKFKANSVDAIEAHEVPVVDE